jgi:hypothetical protein
MGALFYAAYSKLTLQYRQGDTFGDILKNAFF